MELETLILSEISQKERDKYHMISLISGIWYTAQMNLSTEKKIVDLENRLVVAKGEGEGVGWIESWGWQMQSIDFGMDKQWDPAV